MAQNGAVLLSICSSCRNQLKLSTPKVRTFTSTTKRSKTIPSFTPSANEELDDIFLTFRKKYFTPYALSKHHRDFMYKPARHQILLNDPGVTVTLSDGEEIRLMPTEPHDKPNKHQSLKRVSELLGTSKEAKRWNNLPAFLEGMQMAKEKLPNGWLEKIVRKANEMGKGGVIIRCAEMVKKTGFSLADPVVTRELMLGVHDKGAKAGWQGEDLDRAFNESEQIALMLEDPRHCGGKLKEGQQDMRRDLTILGTILELAAAKAISNDKKKDVDSKVSKYVTRLLVIWGERPLEKSDRLEKDLEGWIPLWHGMRLALKVDGVASGSHAEALKTKVNSLTNLVQRTRDEVVKSADGKQRRCLKMYDELSQK